MFVLLVILFVVIPIVELYVIVQVASGIGVLETIGLLIAVSLVGAWLVRREGLSVLRKVQQEMGQGNVPTKQLVDGALILLAGALLLTPGFVTDSFGVLLLLPPTRAVLRNLLISRFTVRIQTASSFPAAGFGGPVYDVGGTEPHGSPEIVNLQRDDDSENSPPPPVLE
ncbi:MAG: FxsA family protein [Acidimicrobiales bacterium]